MHHIVIPFLLLVTATNAVAQPAAPIPGQGFEVRRYNVGLRANLTTAAVSGTETIVVRSTSEGLGRLSFSPNNLLISGATVDGKAVNVGSSMGAIVFTLPRALNKGRTATLRFRFAGIPVRGVTATAGSIYTSYFACDWMVCLQDTPGDKAHFALDLVLPREVESLGVGRALPARALQNDLVLHRWRSTRPYSSYVYAFAAGPFLRQSMQTAQGELLYLDATATKADLASLFADTPAMVAFLSDKAGMALPDRRYVQLLVPGREAQEAAGFSLIGKTELDRQLDDPESAWIIAHELAHQWWGNLVTCATWQDLWLNEGVATFLVAAWKEHRSGPEAYRRELDIARGRLERARAIGYDKPLAWGGKYPSISARRAVQYSKGALFLAHLRASIGNNAFWKGLRLFTQQHAGGTVTSRDFQDAMEKASGCNLAPMFEEWVYGTQA